MIHKLTVHAGHGEPGGRGAGAKGYLDESLCTREIVDLYCKILDNHGVEFRDVTYRGNASAKTILRTLTARMNAYFDWNAINLSVHMNSSINRRANGVECLVYSPSSRALDFAKKLGIILSDECGYTYRGVKYRKGLYVLKHTHSPTVILEVGFVSNKEDAARYNPSYIARAMWRATKNSILL